MKKVDLHNYEKFALDYVEGRLVGDDLSAFELFLKNHPEINDEIDFLRSEEIGFESSIKFDHKTEIKKEALLSEDINSDNYQTYFVAFYENDLSDKTQGKVLEFVKQADKSLEFESFAKLKLIPDQSISFPLKRKVKKTTPVLILYRSLRIAASVAILLGLGWYFNQLNEDEQQYTQRTSELDIKENPEVESDPITQNTVSDFSQELKDDAVELTKINKQKIKLPDQNEITPNELTSIERREFPIMASTSSKGVTIEQQFNTDLKNKPKAEKVALASEDENIFKIKLPKLFRKSDKKDPQNGSTTMARANIKIKKKEEAPDQKTFVDVGPFKVYKKKGVTADASKLSESENGL